ncbi:hypothetical protein [Bradyrhizobium sp. 63_E2_N1_3]|uniref:hypothetical protein n=1 Tax=Bradyrhizobium sp. 63_E2_N1_3 TaxID=3240373 RepID=UPI003F8B5A4D
MKNLEWPGIATAAMIILVLMIAFDLSKWQPIAAALIALGGGFLAYRGAMEKVAVDRDEHRREFVRRQLAQYLKLDIAIRSFRPDVQLVDARMVFLEAGGMLPPQDVVIQEPPELREAWDHLDVFPRRLIREIATIRASIRRLDEILAIAEAGPQTYFSGDALDDTTDIGTLHTQVSAISEACGIILDGLAPEIERLAPKLSQDERQVALYGAPGPDDFDDN